MNNKILKIVLPIIAIGFGQALVAQCSCCDPKTVATEHDHQNASEHGHHQSSGVLSKDQFNQLLTPYLATQKSLAGDDLNASKEGGSAMVDTINSFSKDGSMLLINAAQMIADAPDMKSAREAFLPISDVLISTAKEIELSDESGIYLAYCPMAFKNKGGAWLQDEAVLANPYFGAMMLRCGTIKPLANK